MPGLPFGLPRPRHCLSANAASSPENTCGRPVRARRRGARRLLLAVGLLSPLAAHADRQIERLEHLVQDGRYQAAYELALEERGEREGEPRFDFLYGVAAVESGSLGEAVFALRRVIAVDPRPVIRLQLARAWFLLGEDLQARQEFERVLADDPPAPLRARAERYLHALDGRAARLRTAIRGYLEIGGGRDSNVTTATQADSFDLQGTSIQLDSEDRAQADDFTRIAGGLRISRPLRPGFNVFAELGGERRDHAEHRDSETAKAQLRTGATWFTDGTRTEFAARSRRLELGGDHYRDTTGLDANLRYAVSGVQVAQLGLGFSQLRHARGEQRARDSNLATLVVGTTRLWPVWLRPAVSLFALYGEQRAAEDGELASDGERSMRAAAERDLYGAGADLRLEVARTWVLRAGMSYRRSDYAERDPFFERVRRDTYHSAELALQWHPALDWRVQALLSGSSNESNFGLHDYEREVAELSLRYQF